MTARSILRWSAAALLVVSVGAAQAATREVPLIEAVKRGDAAMARTLLKQGGVNTLEVDGTGALHWAAQNNDVAMVELLLHAGADAKLANRYGITPLYLACVNGNAEVVQRLLAAGADPNTFLPGGETALMTAARTGDADTLKALLARGADPNVREESRKQTALMWAAAEGNAAAIRVLAEGGADIHAISAAPDYVEQGKSRDGFVNYSRKGRLDKLTPLLFAVRGGHIEATKALLDAGADVNEVVPDYGASALTVAMINAHWELGAVLLDRGADPNAATQGWTALHQLIRTRTLSMGQFPLPVATGSISSVQLAEKMLQKGANIEARMTTSNMKDGYRNVFNRVGATPLLLAAKGSDTEMIKFLVAHGADVTATTKNGTNALMLVAGVELQYPDEDGGTGPTALEALNEVIKFPLDVNAVNNAGDTALHGAAYRGWNPIVQILIDKGAKLDVVNKKGSTPLTIADGDRVAGSPQRRPWTIELLVKEMTKQGLPVPDLRTKEKMFDFGTENALGVQKRKSAEGQ
jgi:uncharacterized protein